MGAPTNAKTIEKGSPTRAVAGEAGFVESCVAPASVWYPPIAAAVTADRSSAPAGLLSESSAVPSSRTSGERCNRNESSDAGTYIQRKRCQSASVFNARGFIREGAKGTETRAK